MPRRGNTETSKRNNHKPMHSGAKGKGHSAKVRKAKQDAGRPPKPVREDRRSREK